MESTIDYLQRKLKEVGAPAWEGIAKQVTRKNPNVRVTFHTLRKIAYGERPNLGTVKADALRSHFERSDK